MNTIKFALLGTAAIAAVSVSAQASTASDVAALKAQVEALSVQVAANQAQTLVPAGFQLMTIGTQTATVVPGFSNKGYGTTATVISIMPTADAPAATTVEFAGYVKAALVYDSVQSGSYTYTNLMAKTGFSITGKTDTAVGEVGVKLAFQANWTSKYNNFNGQKNVQTDGAWGWWKMTPELTLAAGYAGSLAGIGYGYDGACTCNFTDNASASYKNINGGDAVQMRLTYASGPMSAAVAIEDYRNSGTQSSLGFAGEVKYTGDMISGEISGGYWDAASFAGPEASYVIGVGAKVALGDIGNVSASAGMGSGSGTTDDFWKANILASLSLSEQAHAEIGFNHLETPQAIAGNQNAVLAGLYYDPVKQLTIGVEGEWISLPNQVNRDSMRADLVTIFRF